MILVSVPLEISSGIFVYDEIIEMHTIHENNHKIIKEPRNGNSKAKKKLVKFSCKVHREVCSDLSSQFVSRLQIYILPHFVSRPTV